MTYGAEEHVSNHVAASVNEEGDSDIDGGRADTPEMRLQHGLKHTVAAQGRKEIHEWQH